MDLTIKNPTGGLIRSDAAGFGYFGAPRSNGRTHNGVDFECTVGQYVLSPIDGIVVRHARPYRDGPLRGIEIKNGDVSIKIFYMEPLKFFSDKVAPGELIGYTQDVTIRYPDQGMTPHVHLEMRINGKLVDTLTYMEH